MALEISVLLEGSIIPGNLNFGPPAEKFIFHLKLPLLPGILRVLDPYEREVSF
jgi:hypothetical protein